MYKLTSGANPLSVCQWHECQNPELCFQHCVGRTALQGDYKIALNRDALAMAKLRRLVLESGEGRQICLLSDHQVIGIFNHLLGTGRLRICRLAEAVSQVSSPVSSVAPPKETEPPPSSAPRRQSSAPPSVVAVADEPENTTFTSNHDPQAQAEALQEASQAGTPFCEECEKLRKQNAASAQQMAH